MRTSQVVLGLGSQDDDLDLATTRELVLGGEARPQRRGIGIEPLRADQLPSVAIVDEEEVRDDTVDSTSGKIIDRAFEIRDRHHHLLPVVS